MTLAALHLLRGVGWEAEEEWDPAFGEHIPSWMIDGGKLSTMLHEGMKVKLLSTNPYFEDFLLDGGERKPCKDIVFTVEQDWLELSVWRLHYITEHTDTTIFLDKESEENTVEVVDVPWGIL